MWFLFFVCFITLIYQPALASSAQVGGTIDCVSLSWECTLKEIKIVGEIAPSTFEDFRRIIDGVHERAVLEKKEAALTLELVELNSPGGSVAAAMSIGRILRKERLNAFIPDGGVCYSSCVLIFAGAVVRSPPEMTGGKLGIHRPYFQEVPKEAVSAEGVTDSYRKILDEIRSYLREMNVSERLADDMLRIEPDKIRLLNDASLKSYGLTDTDPIEQETEDLGEAQLWGISSRKDLIERRSQAAKACPGRFGVPDVGSLCYQAVMKTGHVPEQPDFSKYGTPAR